MDDRITFKCTDCGAPVVIDNENPPDDADIIKCHGCGRTFGSYAEVREALVEAGKKVLDDAIKGAGLPPWINRG